MMRDFELWLNTRFLFGRGVHKKAGNVLKQMGVSRVLIHHDGGAYLYDTGLLESVRDDLESNGMTVWELPGVKPNPRLDLVYEDRCYKGETALISYLPLEAEASLTRQRP